LISARAFLADLIQRDTPGCQLRSSRIGTVASIGPLTAASTPPWPRPSAGSKQAADCACIKQQKSLAGGGRGPPKTKAAPAPSEVQRQRKRSGHEEMEKPVIFIQGRGGVGDKPFHCGLAGSARADGGPGGKGPAQSAPHRPWSLLKVGIAGQVQIGQGPDLPAVFFRSLQVAPQDLFRGTRLGTGPADGERP